MTPTPYLFFHGTCHEALRSYAEIFGGRIDSLMTMGDLPPDGQPPGGIPEDRKGWVMHGVLRIGGGTILASDDLSGQTPAMAGCNISMELPTAAEGRAIFDRLAEGGEVRMPFSPTFWSAGFGMLTDRFGIRWMITSTEAPAAS